MSPRYVRAPVVLACLALVGCGAGDGASGALDEGADAAAVEDTGASDAGPADDAAVATDGASSLAGDAGSAVGLTADFRAWLDAHGRVASDVARDDLGGASFGGRGAPGEPLAHDPVVFVHGNSDRAIGGPLGGWDATLAAFLAAGWSPAELYATTWGPGDPAQAALQYHSREHLSRVRDFVEAVLDYTGAAKVDVVSHSMGVTLARKAIAGGAAEDALAGGAYDLGAPLTSRVDAFVGIAGANLGLASCWVTGPTTPTCGATNGLYPGTLAAGATEPVGMSALLVALDATPHVEGARVASIWSATDEVIGGGGLVWGRPTCALPAQDDERRFDRLTHLELKAKTVSAQLALVAATP